MFDDHPGAVFTEALQDVRGGSGRIAHIVQTIKDSHEIVSLSREFLGLGHFESDAIGNAFTLRGFPRTFNRFVVVIESEELGVWKTLAINMVEAPFPHPTSATLAPASSFSFTSLSEGIHELTRLAAYPGRKNFSHP